MRLTDILRAGRRLPASFHNMPSRYVERQTQFIKKRTPNMVQYEQKIYRYKQRAYYDRWRPWEDDFQSLNKPHVRTKQIFVEPIREWNFFRGDRVEILKGPDKGKQGIINYIVKERNWVFVQGLNVKREVTNKTNTFLGNVATREEPLLINHEVKLVDPTDLMPTEVEWRYDDDGNRVRVSTRTERILPLPSQAYETVDYVEKENYKERPKDTPAKLVNEITFEPKVKTFEMDICDAMGIVEDRVPYPMYWY